MRRALGIAALTLAVGCVNASHNAVAPEGGAVARDAARPVVDAPLDAPCGEAGGRFAALAWVPRSARFAALVELDHPDLAAAAVHLRREPDAEGPALPVYVDFELGTLQLGATTLRATLGEVGLAPAHALKLLDPAGLPLWVIPATCDQTELERRLEARWGLRARATADGRVITAPSAAPAAGPASAESAGTFPFDIVVGAADRIVLAPRGRQAEARAWLATASEPAFDPGRAGGDTGATEFGLGPIVEALPAAPIRAAARGRSLLEPGETPLVEDARRHLTVRADADGLHIEAP